LLVVAVFGSTNFFLEKRKEEENRYDNDLQQQRQRQQLRDIPPGLHSLFYGHRPI